MSVLWGDSVTGRDYSASLACMFGTPDLAQSTCWVTTPAAILVSAKPNAPGQPADDRPLRAQHGPGLSGPWRDQRGGVRILRAPAAGAARLSARRRPRRCARLSRGAAILRRRHRLA